VLILSDPRASIYQRISELAERPARFAGRWHILPVPADIRGPIANPTQALADLLERFSEDDLIAAEVVRRDVQLKLNLAPELSAAGGLLLPLRSSETAGPFALLTPFGCLPTGLCPLNFVQNDIWTIEHAPPGGQLLGVATTREACIWRALGFAALPWIGLDHCNWVRYSDEDARYELLNQALDQEFARIEQVAAAKAARAAAAKAAQTAAERNGQTPAETHDAELKDEDKPSRKMEAPLAAEAESALPLTALGTRPELLLVGFDIGELSREPPPGLMEIRAFLTGMRRYTDDDLFDVGIWQLSADNLDGLEFLLRHGGVDDIRTFLHNVAPGFGADFALPTGDAPASFGATWADLAAAQIHPPGGRCRSNNPLPPSAPTKRRSIESCRR
jgi:hypothetical protein